MFFTAFAQVTFEKYPVPAGTDNSNYRLVADYYSGRKILLPVSQADTVYAQSVAGGSYSAVEEGLFITAFYADNGDLYLAENADVTLLTISGQTVLKKHVTSHEQALDISAIEPGVYLWQTAGSNGKILVK